MITEDEPMKSALCALALVAPWAWIDTAAAAEEPAEAKETAEEEDLPGVAAPAEDFDAIQGLWVRTERVGLFGSRRITKEVKGDTETLTYYDNEGNVAQAHTVKVKLRRAGPIKVFVFTDQEFTAGPNAGQKMPHAIPYVYKLVGNTFVEIWGVLEAEDREFEVLRWERAKSNK
jgi:hypothetical protein